MQNRHLLIGIKLMIRLLAMANLGPLCTVPLSYAGDIESVSARLTEQSFRLLDQLSTHDADHPNSLVGPVAVFAGDADGLRRALTMGDVRSVHSRMASLQADASKLDHVLSQYPNAIAAIQWSSITHQMLELTHEIEPGGPGSSVPNSFGTREDKRCEGCRIETAAKKPIPAVPNEANGADDGPRILITSRESAGGFLWLKGYFEGNALNSAGLFEGASQLKAFKVSGITGRQRVDFDLRLEEPSSATILRVSDIDGRTVEAPVLGVDSPWPRLPPPTEIPSGSTPPIAPPDGRGVSPNSDEDSTTAEIPSHGPLLPSPSKRHALVSKLGDVQIRILNVKRTSDFPPTYEIIGEIAGRGITRAGIYLNGRLLQSIPIIDSADDTRFERRIIVREGSTVIRAYTAGNYFVEQPIDLSDAG
jgi:hypothetical protein